MIGRPGWQDRCAGRDDGADDEQQGYSQRGSCQRVPDDPGAAGAPKPTRDETIMHWGCCLQLVSLDSLRASRVSVWTATRPAAARSTCRLQNTGSGVRVTGIRKNVNGLSTVTA